MGKIDPIIIGGTGAQNKAVIDEAMKTVERDSTLKGEGTAASPLGVDAENLPSEFDRITLNPDSPATLTAEGQIKWCDNFYTPKHDTGLGIIIQSGIVEYYVFYNDIGAIIPSGRVMHLSSGVLISGQLYPTFEYADPRDWRKVQGTLGMTMHDVPVGALGILAKSAQLINADTSGVAAGTQLWIKPDGSGDFTDTVPQFPDIAISIGGSYDSDLNGKVLFNITSSINELFDDAWDGSIIESFDFLVASNGTTVTGTLSNVDPSRNLVIKFSTGFYTLDTTTAPLTIALTPGTDQITATNYVYIPESTKVLTIASGGWPVTEHAKVALLEVQSTANVQAIGGARRNQNINDHLKTTDNNGHILHMAERIRRLNADHDNGTESTLDSTGGNGYVAVTGGQVWQMHLQNFPAFDMATGDLILIKNDFTTPWRSTANLATITAYSTGAAWSNQWSKIVVWGIVNKSGEPSFVVGNLPSNGYNSEANAIADGLNYADYTIPAKYKGVGFLIGSFVIRISGGVITYNGGTAYADLRGFIPNNIAGGGGGGGGVTSFLGLTDTPSSYSGQAYKIPRVNVGESALEFNDGVRVDPSQTFIAANGLTFGDGDSGFYESSDDTLLLQLNGSSRFVWNTNSFYTQVAGGARLRNLTASATNPTLIPNRNSDAAGVGGNGTYVSLISGGKEGARVTGAQITPGYNTETFSATPTFDFNNGNVQELTLTANLTSWTISNDLPAGSYTIYLIQDATGGWAIPDPTGIDKEANESIAAFVTTANAINIVNVFVTPNGVSIWSLVGTA